MQQLLFSIKTEHKLRSKDQQRIINTRKALSKRLQGSAAMHQLFQVTHCSQKLYAAGVAYLRQQVDIIQCSKEAEGSSRTLF